MNVDRAVRRRLEHGWRQKQPIRGDHHGVGPHRTQARRHFRWAQAFGLKNFKAARVRESLHRAWLAPHAAAGRAVRLRQNQRDFMPGLKQPRKRTLGECRGPRED